MFGILSFCALLAWLALQVVAIVSGVILAALTLIWALEERRGKAAPPGRPVLPFLAMSVLEWVLLCAAVLLAPISKWAGRSAPAADTADICLITGWGLGSFPAALMVLRLRRSGFKVAVLSPGSALDDLEGRTLALQTQLEELFENHASKRLDVIAHGDAGVALRAACQATPAFAERIRSAVFLGSPHGGSTAAHLLRGTRWASLRPGSHALERINDDEVLADGSRHVLTIASDTDVLVTPTRAAQFYEAFNIRVDLVGHFGLLTSPRVFDLLQENLKFGAQT